MTATKRFMQSFALSALILTGIGFAQEPPRKPPALIRDTDVAEGKTDADTARKKEYSPLKADDSLKKGNFYFKQKDYAGAIVRFQEAIEYQPDLAEAYVALGKVYEKRGEKEKALAVYKRFLKDFPQSTKAAQFQDLCARLEKKKS